MKYYKNTELARLYNISEKSVRNWITAAEEGKLDLQLYSEGSRTYIANISHNTELIEGLVERGKKYRNSRGFKVVSPTANFYKLYTQEQILDIISNLDIHGEIPLQYSYVNGGAQYWDLYTQKLSKEKSRNSLTNTIELLNLTTDYIFNLIEDYEKINIIDIGVGNCLEIRRLTEQLIEKKKLKKYVAIDVSKDMLRIGLQNMEKWFGGQIEIEGHIRDIHHDRFDDLLLADSFRKDATSTANLVLFMGGTISNFREPDRALSTIHDSMGKNDLMILSKKLDTESSRRYFDFTIGPENISRDFRDLCLELLNIQPAYYKVEQFFDKEAMCRVRQVRLEVALSIEFKFGDKQRTLEFSKGDTILLWRVKHQDAIETFEQLDKNNFDLLQSTRSKDSAQEYIQVISQIKTSKR